MNILLTSVGRRSYMISYFKEALKGIGQVHAANSADTYALRVADKAVLTPLIYNETYRDFLLSYCIEHNIKAVISLFDMDLPILAKAKPDFLKHGITVVVSDYEITQICNDKWRTFLFLKENNILTPKTYLLIQDVLLALGRKEISFPMIIKPRWGMGSIAIFLAKNVLELTVLFEKVKVEIANSYLKFESEKDVDQAVLIQEYLIGPEYGLDIINDLHKQYIATFVKRKIAMRAGETDSAITEDNLQLTNLGKTIASKLGHIANLDVDCFLVEDKPYVLEMNCRFGGGYPFTHLSGADIPLAIIHWLKGENPPANLFSIKYGMETAKDIQPVISRMV